MLLVSAPSLLAALVVLAEPSDAGLGLPETTQLGSTWAASGVLPFRDML